VASFEASLKTQNCFAARWRLLKDCSGQKHQKHSPFTANAHAGPAEARIRRSTSRKKQQDWFFNTTYMRKSTMRDNLTPLMLWSRQRPRRLSKSSKTSNFKNSLKSIGEIIVNKSTPFSRAESPSPHETD